MKKIHVGIDISKEKCNLCFRSGLEIVRSKAKISKRANQTMKALLHLAAVSAATHMKQGEYKDYL